MIPNPPLPTHHSLLTTPNPSLPTHHSPLPTHHSLLTTTFTFSTQEILSRDCADEVVSAIPIVLNDHTRFSVRFCLHEALYNAALHGNLEIDDLHHAGLNQKIEARLSDPVLEARPVFVTCHPQEGVLDIAVRDFGPPAALMIEGEIEGIRGLALIQQLTQKVTFDAQRKELVMHFFLGAAA